MNKTDRQTYKDCTIDEAFSHGCDIVQLKYDGHWNRHEVLLSGEWTNYSRTSNPVDSGQTNAASAGVYIGELMRGTQWAQSPEYLGRLFLFDMWSVGDADLTMLPYAQRLRWLRTAIQSHNLYGGRAALVQSYPIAKARELWESHVLGKDFEGLVYRRSAGDINDTVYRTKADFEETWTITGKQVGQGKYSNTLGALICVTDSGVEGTVGGGMDDLLRFRLWRDENLIGKRVKVRGKKKFLSGLLRHPVFVELL